MAQHQDLADYAASQDNIDIVAKYDNLFRSFAETNPYLRLAKILPGDYAVAYIPIDKLAETVAGLNESYTRIIPKPMGLLGREALNAAGILEVQSRPYMNLRGSGTIVGLVDTGIDFTKPAFQYEDGSSKIAYIWDQTAEHIGQDSVFMGREYSAHEIAQAISAENPAAAISHRDENGHGTFLASVAAGRESESEIIGAAPDAQIIMVKLRPMKNHYRDRFRVPENQDYAYSSIDFLLGVNYIIEKASEMNMPVSLCVGLGASFGSRDGVSILDEFLSTMALRRGVAIAVAAGNEANTKHHTMDIIPQSGQSRTFEVRVGENVPSFTCYIWNRPQDSLYISVKSPTGETITTQPVFIDSMLTKKLVLEKSTITIYNHFPASGTGNDLTELIVDVPTPGIWSITVNALIVLDGTFHVWMPIAGFISPDVEFITPNPNFTITIPASSPGVITVGAYDYRNGSLYPASSWGPSRAGTTSPEMVAPGVEVTGILPTGAGAMTGTSVAAAMVAGASALMLQWGIVDKNYPNLNNLRLRAFLMQGASRETNITYPNDQWGYGKLNLMRTFDVLKG